VSERQQDVRTIKAQRSGQITIPASFRARLGIADNTMLRVTLVNDELRIKPIRPTEAAAGSPWLKELYDYFAPVRQEAKDEGFTEDEINTAIDAAVRAVRSRNA
jgi:AbrB family looped-hinge helix DNA binding protein